MQQIPVTFKKLSVTKFTPQTEELTLRLIVNDGADKQMIKSCRVDDAERIAVELLAEARRKIKEAHPSEGGLGPLEGITVIKLTQDEGVVMERTQKFLANIRERIRSAKAKRLSWFDMEKQIVDQSAEY